MYILYNIYMNERTHNSENIENMPIEERISSITTALEALDAEGILTKNALSVALQRIEELRNFNVSSKARQTIRELQNRFGIASNEIISGKEFIIPDALRADLTNAEEAVLNIIMNNSDSENYVSTEEIVKKMWGNEISGDIAPSRLRTRIAKIRRKLEKFNLGKIESRHGKGYRFVKREEV